MNGEGIHARTASMQGNDHGQRDQSYADDNSINESAGDSPTRQGRKRKRRKYVVAACTECKRRKIKCNGNTPCQRCNNLSLACVYQPRANSHEEPSSTLSLQQLQSQYSKVASQLDALTSTVNQLVNLSAANHQHASEYQSYAIQPPATPNVSQYQQTVQTPTNASVRSLDTVRERPHRRSSSSGTGAVAYSGPTSSDFSLNVAKRSLVSWGIDGDGIGEKRQQATFTSTPSARPDGAGRPNDRGRLNDEELNILIAQEQLLLSLGKEKACGLFHYYNIELNVMFPMVAMNEFVPFYERIWDAPSNIATYSKSDICMIKMMLAISMAAEERDIDIAAALYEQVLTLIERDIMDGPVDAYLLRNLVLVHMYQFHCDLQTQAYRSIGFAARIVNELGLHSSAELNQMFTDDHERKFAVKLVWTVYILDRRMSFGTGRPYSMRDDDIDQVMPGESFYEGQVVDENSILIISHLRALIDYSRLSTKVWKVISRIGKFPAVGKASANPTIEDVRAIDRLITEWSNALPDRLRFNMPIVNGSDERRLSSGREAPLWHKKLPVMLFIRANQMRLHAYRPYLLSPEAIQENTTAAIRAVDIAKETIEVLNHLHQTTPLYTSCQSHYNYFLINALVTIFIAIIHDPKTFCGPQKCRVQFDMAIDLVKVLKKDSKVGARLWATIKGLKGIARKISGLSRGFTSEASGEISPNESDDEDSGNNKRRINGNTGAGSPHPPTMSMADLGPLANNFHPNIHNTALSTQPRYAQSGPQPVMNNMPIVPTPPVQDFDMSTELNEIFFLATAANGSNNMGNDSNGFLTGSRQSQHEGWTQSKTPPAYGGMSPKTLAAWGEGSFPFGIWPDADLTKVLGPWL